MKISTIAPVFKINVNNNPENNAKSANEYTSSSQINSLSNIYYKDYSVNFKAKRTPENFFEQEFNANKMPDTMKKYLLEDFEKRCTIAPAQLQKEAFQWLSAASSVEDVKAEFPDEPLFKDLKSATQTKAKRGYLADLRMTDSIGAGKIEKSRDDLSVYLLKKIYLEGKTLDEINKDFHREVKQEFRLAKGEYFNYSTLKSLGVNFPDRAYWHSFLATRDDFSFSKGKPRNYYSTMDRTEPVVRKPITEETRQKMSLSQIERHKNMSPSEKQELIYKIVSGQENSSSVFIRFRKQIMTLAPHRSGMSRDMRESFERLLENDSFKNKKFNSQAARGKVVFDSFWKRYPDDGGKFSAAIIQCIGEFEDAYAKGETSPELMKLFEEVDFYNTQKKLLAKEKAGARAMGKPIMTPSSPEPPQEPQAPIEKTPSVEDIKAAQKKEMLAQRAKYNQLKEEYKRALTQTISDLPDGFKNCYIKFMTEHPINTIDVMDAVLHIDEEEDALTSRIALMKGISKLKLDLHEDEINEFLERKIKIKSILSDMNDEFDDKYFRHKNSSEQALNEVVAALAPDHKVLGMNRAEALQYIQDKKIGNEVQKMKKIINALYIEYQSARLSDDSIKTIFNNEIKPLLLQVVNMESPSEDVMHDFEGKFGDVKKLMNSLVKETRNGIIVDPQEQKEFERFLQDVGGRLKYYFKDGVDRTRKLDLSVSLIYDYLLREVLPRVK